MNNNDPRLGKASASGFGIVVACPGQQQLKASLVAENKIALDRSDELAESGNRIHKARQTGDTSELNEQELELYQNGMEFEKQIVAKWAQQYGITAYHEGPREERLYLHHPETMEPLTSAQLDVQWESDDGDYACVIDWKSFFAPHSPPAPSNWQIRLQAVCKWKEMEHVKVVRGALNRCAVKVGANDYVDYGVSDLQASEQSIFYHLWESEQPGAPRRAGAWCFHCPCNAACPEAATYAMLPSVMAQRALPESQKVEDMVAALGHADLKKIWDASTTIGKIIDAVDSRLKGLSKEELDALGLELPDHGRKLNTIVAPDGAWEHLKTVHGFEDGELWSVLDMSRGALAKLVAAKQGLAQAKAMAWVDEVLKPYIQFGYARPSLREKKTTI